MLNQSTEPHWPGQFFFKDFIYLFIFREKGREGEKEGEKHRLVASCVHPDQGPSL